MMDKKGCMQEKELYMQGCMLVTVFNSDITNNNHEIFY